MKLRALAALLLPLWLLGTEPARAQSRPQLSLAGTRAAFFDLALAPGWSPDPMPIPVITGGFLDSETMRLGTGCTGWIAERAELRFVVTRPVRWLRLYVKSEGADTTLIVRMPNGRVRCGNDSFGTTDPSVELSALPRGRYDVWVGNRAPRQRVRATVYLTASRTQHP